MYSTPNKIKIQIILLFLSNIAYSQIQWPVPQLNDSDDAWWRVSAGFCEIHSHLHGGIDIDNQQYNQPFYPCTEGTIITTDDELSSTTPGIGGHSITLEHPTASGEYHRRSRYLHVIPNSSLSQGDNVTINEDMGVIEDANHLHFEMWERIDGVWFQLNPLRNDRNWVLSLPEGHQDAHEVVINDIYFCPINAASGYNILNTNSDNPAIRHELLAGSTIGRIHFSGENLSTTNGNNYSIFEENTDKLSIFGSIGTVVQARDLAINAPISSGKGATIYECNFFIENELKYSIEFDRIGFVNEFNDEWQIFRAGTPRYGNNDYINMYKNSGNYIFPHKKINDIQSNGIWFTRAKNTTSTVFENTPTQSAIISKESLYPDGTYNVKYSVSDPALHTDEIEFPVLIDNFRPYVETVEMTTPTSVMYTGTWDWEPDYDNGAGQPSGRLKLERTMVDEATTSGNVPINIDIYLSEPMYDVELFIQDANNYTGFASNPQGFSADRTHYIFQIVPTQILSSCKGEQTLVISGTDMAGNELLGLQEAAIDESTYSATQLPYRTGATTWSTDFYETEDLSHRFIIDCSYTGNNGFMQTSCMSPDFELSAPCGSINTQTTICPGTLVTVTDISSGNIDITERTWDFGAGATATPLIGTAGNQTSWSVVWDTNGDKTITLNVSDGSNTESVSIAYKVEATAFCYCDCTPTQPDNVTCDNHLPYLTDMFMYVVDNTNSTNFSQVTNLTWEASNDNENLCLVNGNSTGNWLTAVLNETNHLEFDIYTSEPLADLTLNAISFGAIQYNLASGSAGFELTDIIHTPGTNLWIFVVQDNGAFSTASYTDNYYRLHFTGSDMAGNQLEVLKSYSTYVPDNFDTAFGCVATNEIPQRLSNGDWSSQHSGEDNSFFFSINKCGDFSPTFSTYHDNLGIPYGTLSVSPDAVHQNSIVSYTLYDNDNPTAPPITYTLPTAPSNPIYNPDGSGFCTINTLPDNFVLIITLNDGCQKAFYGHVPVPECVSGNVSFINFAVDQSSESGYAMVSCQAIISDLNCPCELYLSGGSIDSSIWYDVSSEGIAEISGYPLHTQEYNTQDFAYTVVDLDGCVNYGTWHYDTTPLCSEALNTNSDAEDVFENVDDNNGITVSCDITANTMEVSFYLTDGFTLPCQIWSKNAAGIETSTYYEEMPQLNKASILIEGIPEIGDQIVLLDGNNCVVQYGTFSCNQVLVSTGCSGCSEPINHFSLPPVTNVDACPGETICFDFTVSCEVFNFSSNQADAIISDPISSPECPPYEGQIKQRRICWTVPTNAANTAQLLTVRASRPGYYCGTNTPCTTDRVALFNVQVAAPPTITAWQTQVLNPLTLDCNGNIYQAAQVQVIP